MGVDINLMVQKFMLQIVPLHRLSQEGHGSSVLEKFLEKVGLGSTASGLEKMRY